MAIYIFSREIRSGKTTELMQAFAANKGVAGVLMPDVNGLRHVFELASKNTYPVQLSENSPEKGSIKVGRFSFSQLAFQHAEQSILKSLETSPEWVIVDEIGKLELDNSGFHQAVHACLEACKQQVCKQLVLVVRDSLLVPVIEKYHLQEAMVIQDLSLLNLLNS